MSRSAEDLFILIAEDDEDDRFLLKTVFEEQGYKEKIEFVENGVEVIDFLKEKEFQKKYPALIFLDLNMPKKDGRETLLEIKQHPDFKKIPVIIFTTTKNDIEIKKCYELGANTYVVKPVSFDSLIKTISDIRNFWLNTACIPVGF